MSKNKELLVGTAISVIPKIYKLGKDSVVVSKSGIYANLIEYDVTVKISRLGYPVIKRSATGKITLVFQPTNYCENKDNVEIIFEPRIDKKLNIEE